MLIPKGYFTVVINCLKDGSKGVKSLMSSDSRGRITLNEFFKKKRVTHQ